MNMEWRQPLESETSSTKRVTPIRSVTTTIFGGHPAQFTVNVSDPDHLVEELAKFLWRWRHLASEPLK
jgi:hypothetical protein